MTVPRLLHLDHDRLHQSPAPELLSLRKGESWQATHVRLSAAETLTLPGVVGTSRLDIEVSSRGMLNLQSPRMYSALQRSSGEFYPSSSHYVLNRVWLLSTAGRL